MQKAKDFLQFIYNHEFSVVSLKSLVAKSIVVPRSLRTGYKVIGEYT